MLLSSDIKAAARAAGFSAVGISRAEPMSEAHVRRRADWLAAGRHAGMAYLEANEDKRRDPRLLVDGARSIVSVAMNYFTPDAPTADAAYSIARYARGTDYHDVVRVHLRQMLSALGLIEHADGRVFTDTAPIDERYWAVRAGLGWTGRSGQLIIPGAGTYFFLGELVLTHDVDAYDAPIPARCGTCRACLDACPASALLGDGTLDARRCLSYLTIEHRGALPEGTGRLMGHTIYGCDRCADVCPWNAHARPTAEPLLQPRPALMAMNADDWHALSPERYRELFRGSAVKRAKFEGLQRNVDAVRQALAHEAEKADGEA